MRELTGQHRERVEAIAGAGPCEGTPIPIDGEPIGATVRPCSRASAFGAHRVEAVAPPRTWRGDTA